MPDNKKELSAMSIGEKNSFMENSVTDSGYKALAVAIVTQAVTDYADALYKKRKKEAIIENFEAKVKELEYKQLISDGDELYKVNVELEKANSKISHAKTWIAIYDGLIHENEVFFYSDWFGILCDLDPDTIVNKVKERMAQKKLNIQKPNERDGVPKVLNLKAIL